jgi:hypothetical protein
VHKKYLNSDIITQADCALLLKMPEANFNPALLSCFLWCFYRRMRFTFTQYQYGSSDCKNGYCNYYYVNCRWIDELFELAALGCVSDGEFVTPGDCELSGLGYGMTVGAVP